MASTAHGSDPSSNLVHGFQNELELLQRHVKMIKFVEEHGPIGIIRLSALLGVPKHKVRYSLRILEKEGFLNASPQGATTTADIDRFFQKLETELLDVTKKMENIRQKLRTHG